MRHTGNIFDGFNSDIKACKRAHSRIAAKPYAFDEYICAAESILLLGSLAGTLGSNLGGICSTFLGTAESTSSGAAGCQYGTAHVGKGDDSIIERRQYMYLSGCDGPLGFFTFGSGCSCFCHSTMSYLLLS